MFHYNSEEIASNSIQLYIVKGGLGTVVDIGILGIVFYRCNFHLFLSKLVCFGTLLMFHYNSEEMVSSYNIQL
jgi:putative flippase GtrA